MSNPTYSGALNAPSLDVVVGMFLSVLTRPLQTQFVDFELDAPNSQLIVRGKDSSSNGETGIYSGEYRWTYNKADLAALIPYALPIEVEYPVSLRQVRAHLLNRYQISLEELEFAQTIDGTAMNDDDVIDQPLANAYPQLRLYATANSGRFVRNSALSLIFIQPNKRIQIRTLVDSPKADILSVLVGG